MKIDKYPVELGKTYKAQCIDINHEGMGVYKINDFICFAFNSVIGEECIIKITKITSNYAFGEIKEILKESKNRISPICKHFLECGGCDLMHMNYSSQLDYKKNMVISTLKKIGHIELNDLEIIGAKNLYYYRNKVQVPFTNLNGKTICGFYKKKSHFIIPLSDCYIQPKLTTEIAKFVKNICNELGILGYDEDKKTGYIRTTLIRKTADEKYMVVLISKTKNIPNLDLLVDKIKSHYKEVESIILNIQEKANNTILGEDSFVLYGKDEIIDTILGKKYKLSHKSFLQINHEQTEVLYQIVRDFANLSNREIVLDAYCGVGTIGLSLADSAKEVYGIEIVKEAIDNAKENAKLNSISNARYFVGASEEIIKELDVNFDLAIFDPPRKGCDRKFLETIVEKKIPKLIYVSCDPATLARDLDYLKEYYRLERIKCVDLFPNSIHCETVVKLYRK